MSIKSRHRNRADAIHVRRAVVVRIAVVVDIGEVRRGYRDYPVNG